MVHLQLHKLAMKAAPAIIALVYILDNVRRTGVPVDDEFEIHVGVEHSDDPWIEGVRPQLSHGALAEHSGSSKHGPDDVQILQQCQAVVKAELVESSISFFSKFGMQ